MKESCSFTHNCVSTLEVPSQYNFMVNELDGINSG